MNDEKRTGNLPDQGHEGQDLVERLIEAAGPGPEIPEDGAEQIKNALRPEWREGVAARQKHTRRAWLGGGLAAAAAVIFFAVVLPSMRETLAPVGETHFSFSEIRGSLEMIAPDGSSMTVGPTQTAISIRPGSWIRTDIGSRVAIETDTGQSVRLDRNTRVRLDSHSLIQLERGAVYVDSGHGGGIEIRTSMGSARDIGTQFEVRRENQELAIRVREGLVSLERGEETLEIEHGTVVNVTADGSTASTVIDAWDPSWTWVQEIAPALEIEGRSAAEFLEWYAREAGLGLHFEKPGVAQFAETTILHGSIDGLSPSDALLTVLPGSRLVIEVESGALKIDTAD